MAKDDRNERRAAALRANLRRRKGQARAVAQAGEVPETAAGTDDAADQRLADDRVI